MKFWRNKKVLVTGGSSMIGSRVVIELQYFGANVYYPTHAACDLLDKQAVNDHFQYFKPEYVFHLAGYNGGIKFNLEHPAEIFFRTVQMGLNVLRTCEEFKVNKVLSVISSCAYPPLGEACEESELWDGLPDPSVECHGLAKRFLDGYSRQLQRQGINAICCIANNSMGPKDNFSETGKVVGSLIRKFYENDTIEVWGSGAPRREFIYSHDLAKLLIIAMERYDDVEPINITSGQEISIKELVTLLKDIFEKRGYNRTVKFDTTKPDGQYRKYLSMEKMTDVLGEFEFTPLQEVLEETVDWYIWNRYINK